MIIGIDTSEDKRYICVSVGLRKDVKILYDKLWRHFQASGIRGPLHWK